MRTGESPCPAGKALRYGARFLFAVPARNLSELRDFLPCMMLDTHRGLSYPVAGATTRCSLSPLMQELQRFHCLRLPRRVFWRRLLTVYSSVSRDQIADALIHLRGLFREMPSSSDRDDRAHERREILTKNLLSNLFRTKDHPTLNLVLEVADAFSLTLDGAHRLFGYELERIREYDLALNAGRTHIIESYPFERDRPVDLPFHFSGEEAFATSATVQNLVSSWHADTPIRTLESGGWQQPSAFYVRVGTEDSLGSSLPAGSTALVVPVDEAERQRPNPRAIYLLQFGNGYRCSRCVVTRGKLILLSSSQRYVGAQEFAYPANVRIAGRIRMFALGLPLPEYPLLYSLPPSQQSAPLVLPWEHGSLDHLFRSKHRRFRRSRQELSRIREAMEGVFHTRISGRTERRYRRPTSSMPHIDALIQLTVRYAARYSDVLRVQRPRSSDRGRYSLDTLLNTQHLRELTVTVRRSHPPIPRDRWMKFRNEFIEWPALLSLRFPQLSSVDERIVRLAEGITIQSLDPPVVPGSMILVQKPLGLPDVQREAQATGWCRPLYAIRRGTDLLCGHLDRTGNQYFLLAGAHKSSCCLNVLSRFDNGAERKQAFALLAPCSGSLSRALGIGRASESAEMRKLRAARYSIRKSTGCVVPGVFAPSLTSSSVTC